MKSSLLWDLHRVACCSKRLFRLRVLDVSREGANPSRRSAVFPDLRRAANFEDVQQGDIPMLRYVLTLCRPIMTLSGDMLSFARPPSHGS